MGKTILTRLIVASLLSLWPDQLINFRELEDGTAITLTPTGQKYYFKPEELAAEEQRLITLETSKLQPAAIAGPNPILDKIMETKKTSGRGGSQITTITETEKHQTRPVTKKGRGGSKTRPSSK